MSLYQLLYLCKRIYDSQDLNDFLILNTRFSNNYTVKSYIIYLLHIHLLHNVLKPVLFSLLLLLMPSLTSFINHPFFYFYILYISKRTERRYTRFRFNTPHIIIYVFIGSRTIITIPPCFFFILVSRFKIIKFHILINCSYTCIRTNSISNKLSVLISGVSLGGSAVTII